jgi:hypothetical protein
MIADLCEFYKDIYAGYFSGANCNAPGRLGILAI